MNLSALRARPHREPGLLQRGKLRLRYVLVVERHSVAAGRERQEVVGRLVVAEHGVGDYLGGAFIRRRGEDAEPDAQSDCRWCGHPG